MNDLISPKYLMSLVKEVEDKIWEEYKSYKEVEFYIKKWHQFDDYNNYWENFAIAYKQNGGVDLTKTLHNIDGETLLKIAIDLGVNTPDFLPSIPMFKNEIKSSYKTAYSTFNKALKEIENNPDVAVGLVNSALESIIKEILKDDNIKSKVNGNETLYKLSLIILKEFNLNDNNQPKEIKTIGNSLLAINQAIEKIRSEKTSFHGKTDNDFVINDSIYSYFIVNSVTTIALFLNSYYKKHYHQIVSNLNPFEEEDDLPF